METYSQFSLPNRARACQTLIKNQPGHIKTTGAVQNQHGKITDKGASERCNSQALADVTRWQEACIRQSGV